MSTQPRSSSRLFLSLLLAALLVPFGATIADATTLRPISLDTLTRDSDAIVLGTVVAQQARFERGVIWTTSTLEVEQCIAGDCADVATLEVRTPGGEVAGVAQRIAGVTAVEPGGTYVMFLERGADRALRPVALVQGVVAVVPTASGRMAMEPSADVAVMAPDGRLIAHERPHQRRMEVASLITIIQNLRAVTPSQPR